MNVLGAAGHKKKRSVLSAVLRARHRGFEHRGAFALKGLIGRDIVKVDPRYFRPAEVESLLGDATKAREKLGWVPKTSFEDLVAEMVAYDLDQAKRFSLLKARGFEVAACEE